MLFVKTGVLFHVWENDINYVIYVMFLSFKQRILTFQSCSCFSVSDFSLGLRWCEVSSGYVPQTHQPGHWSPHHSVSDGQSFTPGGSGPCSAGQDQGRAVLLRWLWWQKGVWTALVVLACVLMLLNLSVSLKDPMKPHYCISRILISASGKHLYI